MEEKRRSARVCWVSFAGLDGTQEIRTGEKIYIGMLTNGDSINTGAMEHPDKDTLKWKSFGNIGREMRSINLGWTDIGSGNGTL